MNNLNPNESSHSNTSPTKNFIRDNILNSKKTRAIVIKTKDKEKMRTNILNAISRKNYDSDGGHQEQSNKTSKLFERNPPQSINSSKQEPTKSNSIKPTNHYMSPTKISKIHKVTNSQEFNDAIQKEKRGSSPHRDKKDRNNDK